MVRTDSCSNNEPWKSPTLIPLKAMTGWSAASYCSACLPHKVIRTEKLERSTMVSSRFGIYNAHQGKRGHDVKAQNARTTLLVAFEVIVDTSPTSLTTPITSTCFNPVSKYSEGCGGDRWTANGILCHILQVRDGYEIEFNSRHICRVMTLQAHRGVSHPSEQIEAEKHTSSTSVLRSNVSSYSLFTLLNFLFARLTLAFEIIYTLPSWRRS